MGANSASVFALYTSTISFDQIIKSVKPVFVVIFSYFVYDIPVSKATWLCVPTIIGGTILSSTVVLMKDGKKLKTHQVV